jgi:CRP-like cAMP-binding protein
MTRNRILDLLPADLKKIAARAGQPVDLPQGKLLYEQDSIIEHVYFPDRGMISLVGATQRGDSLEIAMVGIDSAAGCSAVLSEPEAYCRATVQITGAGFAIPARVLRDLSDKHLGLRKVLAESEQLVVRQVVQSAVCIATHDVPSRFARWLLRCRDATRSDVLPLTHEYIAEMLAVRRASVSAAALEFQKKGLIRYQRGTINILDAHALHDVSCECYERQDPPGGAGR